MTLEFERLIEQLDEMGREVATRARRLGELAEYGRELLSRFSEEWELINARIALVRSRNLGYRGAGALDEPLASTFEAPEPPSEATLMAVDGSQVYPDRHGPVLYYLINVGGLVLRHGSPAPPEQFTDPRLFYGQGDVLDEGHQVIASGVVSARRSVAEIEKLAELATSHRDGNRPLIALADGPLLFWAGAEVSDKERKRLLERYLAAMERLRDAGALPVGYTDRPRSRFVVSLLHLLSLPEDEITANALTTNGRLEGLSDRLLFNNVLGPGMRTALFVQQSPANKSYRLRNGDLEIAFFYVNVSRSGKPWLARVEVPMWVAMDKEAVGHVHSMLLTQCGQLGGRPYPYLLARADELAVVGRHEKRELENLIELTLRRYKLEPERSAKDEKKRAARAGGPIA